MKMDFAEFLEDLKKRMSDFTDGLKVDDASGKAKEFAGNVADFSNECFNTFAERLSELYASVRGGDKDTVASEPDEKEKQTSGCEKEKRENADDVMRKAVDNIVDLFARGLENLRDILDPECECDGECSADVPVSDKDYIVINFGVRTGDGEDKADEKSCKCCDAKKNDEIVDKKVYEKARTVKKTLAQELRDEAVDNETLINKIVDMAIGMLNNKVTKPYTISKIDDKLYVTVRVPLTASEIHCVDKDVLEEAQKRIITQGGFSGACHQQICLSESLIWFRFSL